MHLQNIAFFLFYAVLLHRFKKDVCAESVTGVVPVGGLHRRALQALTELAYTVTAPLVRRNGELTGRPQRSASVSIGKPQRSASVGPNTRSRAKSVSEVTGVTASGHGVCIVVKHHVSLGVFA